MAFTRYTQGKKLRKPRYLQPLSDNLKYLGRIGNEFHTKNIYLAIERDKQYDPNTPNAYTKNVWV
ncbi:hypothetical protein BH18THE2_BH18THE2_30330 [soil metagenome]